MTPFSRLLVIFLLFTIPLLSLSAPAHAELDSDWIPDLQDLCPHTNGLTELHGCAPQFGDFDADGVPDLQDQCPYSKPFLPVNAEGCSPHDLADDDSDGVINGLDLCPTETNWSGVNFGCPYHLSADDDGDGIMNALDLCPHIFGPKAQNGCSDFWLAHWDLDFDGLDNQSDHCPFTMNAQWWTQTGPNGCAIDPQYEDTDQDGISNAVDLCPLSPAGHLVDFNGCTAVQAHQREDSDGDGVKNVFDLCHTPYLLPYDRRLITLYGCHMGELDNDFDGLPDTIDLCRWEPGHRLFGGCPQPPHMWNDVDFDGTPDPYDDCPYSSPIHNPAFNPSGCNGNDLLDFDLDGVINGRDLCPASPPGGIANEDGCNELDRMDFDQDGVMNGVDLCPHIPGLPSRNGCAPNLWDLDQDGVPNELDQCPYSLPYALVDQRGCGSSPHTNDRDGDGVPDYLDQCDNTPTEQAADRHSGCSWQQEFALYDEDRDGVSDRLDMCYGTLSTSPVDKHGCELMWPQINDLDGDQVPNYMDLCPNTRRGVAIDHNGCEIFQGLHIAENLHFPFPQDGHVLEISADEIPVSWPAFQHHPMPLVFELYDVAIQEPQMPSYHVWNSGSQLSISFYPQPTRPIRVPVRLRTHYGELVSNWFEIVVGRSTNTQISSSLIVNDPNVLNMTGINLRVAFSLLRSFSTHPQPDVELYKQLWDSQRSFSNMNLPFFCQWEINGFPIVCDQPGTEVSEWNEHSIESEMHNFRLVAVVNRMDLHNDWQDCGEHRLVFALQNPITFRKFINLEARVPNSMPGNIQGCRTYIEFWRDLANVNGQEQAQRLNQFFYGGLPNIPSVIQSGHFLAETGQIRTSQAWHNEWIFKEHQLEEYCGEFHQGPCQHWIRTISVKENPFGELFNPQTPFQNPSLSNLAQDFQQWFPQNLSGLLTNNPVLMHNRVEERFNHGQSHAGNPNQLENDYLAHFGGDFWSNFGMNIEMAIQGHVNADGSPMTVENILSRATAMTCGGCHAPDVFLSNFKNNIGVLALSNGQFIHEWPASHDFVHINEQGELSTGMIEVFLPERDVIFKGMLNTLEF